MLQITKPHIVGMAAKLKGLWFRMRPHGASVVLREAPASAKEQGA